MYKLAAFTVHLLVVVVLYTFIFCTRGIFSGRIHCEF